MSYQPEERYWTDYLRIALPVVGLLLMLGLFWYWASQTIGNDGDEDRTPTPLLSQMTTATAPAPTATSPVNLVPATTAPEPTADTGAGDTPTDTPADSPTDEPTDTGGKGFAVDDLVVTNDEVNLRAGPSTDDEILEILDANTELTVNQAATGADPDGRFWVGVTTPDGTEGFVADEFLDASGSN